MGDKNREIRRVRVSENSNYPIAQSQDCLGEVNLFDGLVLQNCGPKNPPCQLSHLHDLRMTYQNKLVKVKGKNDTFAFNFFISYVPISTNRDSSEKYKKVNPKDLDTVVYDKIIPENQELSQEGHTDHKNTRV